MKRILNVTVISSLALIMACAPASRQQAIPKKIVAKQNTPPVQQQPEIDPATGKSVVSQQGTGPHAESKVDPVSVGKLKLSTVAFKQLKDGGAELKIETQDGDKKTLYRIEVTSTGQTITNDDVTQSQFLCDDGTTNNAQCPNSTFIFTLKSQSLTAKVTMVMDWVFDEQFVNTAKEELDGSADTSAASYKANVGQVHFHKVVVSDGSSSIMGIHADFKFNGVSEKTPEDDVQISADANIKVKVYGLPIVDLQNNPIVTEAAINKTTGITSRQEEYVPMIPNKDDTDKFIRYSVPVYASKDTPKGTTPIRLLILTARSADAAGAAPSAPATSAPPTPEPASATPPAPLAAKDLPATTSGTNTPVSHAKPNMFTGGGTQDVAADDDEIQEVQVTATKTGGSSSAFTIPNLSEAITSFKNTLNNL